MSKSEIFEAQSVGSITKTTRGALSPWDAKPNPTKEMAIPSPENELQDGFLKDN